jgi:hypothetical protein
MGYNYFNDSANWEITKAMNASRQSRSLMCKLDEELNLLDKKELAFEDYLDRSFGHNLMLVLPDYVSFISQPNHNLAEVDLLVIKDFDSDCTDALNGELDCLRQTINWVLQFRDAKFSVNQNYYFGRNEKY